MNDKNVLHFSVNLAQIIKNAPSVKPEQAVHYRYSTLITVECHVSIAITSLVSGIMRQFAHMP
jgi:hypothetical protein